MKQTMVKVLLILSIVTVVVVSSGCGSKGDLYFPEQSQSTDK